MACVENNIGDEGATAIAQCLLVNRSLSVIDLSGTYLSPSVLSCIMPSTANNIASRGMNAVAKNLPRSTLSLLDLSRMMVHIYRERERDSWKEFAMIHFLTVCRQQV